MNQSIRISKKLIMCYSVTQVISASAGSVREEMEFLFQEPKNDIFAPVTEAIIQARYVVVIVAIVVAIVIGLVLLIKNKKL